MTPTRRSLLLVAAGLAVAILPSVGFRRTWPATVFFWAGSAAVLGADALLTPRRRDVVWEVEAPETLHVGSSGRLGLTLRMDTTRPLPAEVAVALSPDLAPQPPARALVSARTARFEWELVPERRGIARIEDLSRNL